ncbi:MAG: thiamine biosynthesis protein [Deltaproteobacteria bacterium]|nr:MAG: thiamine biosynthesis protein [Deltaproteobacteria bacterium]
MTAVKAVALFSGGLDSILAAKVVAEQGVEVLAVQFVTPFFGTEIMADTGYIKRVKEKYHLDLRLENISNGYLELLRKPLHGFGKNFNPCIDCKILMVSRAREIMAEIGASFIISGEVLGQRPMSQRRDTLNVIARDSGTKMDLLRPLSAKLMPPTRAETEGLVDRERLYGFSGRGRSAQIALAGQLGITDFPAPAGGCILADPILSRRIKRVYQGDFVVKPGEISEQDVSLMLLGRQFVLPGGLWFILGRNKGENQRLKALASAEDLCFYTKDRPGPFGLLRRGKDHLADGEVIKKLCGLVVRYGKKVENAPAGTVAVNGGDRTYFIQTMPLDDEIFSQWLWS